MKYKIIVDKQPMTTPSDEKKEYIIDIEELRVKGDVYDSLNIEKDRTYVTRRLSLSEYGVLSILEEPKQEELTDINIKLFEGDNYIYLLDMTGNKFYAEYIVKNDFTDIYVTKNEMNSSINQTAQNIELSVNQKLEGYSNTEEMNATIKVTADGINSQVSKKVGKDEIISNINQSAEAVQINANKISLEGKKIDLTGDNVTISSNNFNVDKNGNVTLRDDTKTDTRTSFKVTNTNGDRYVILKPYFLEFENKINGNYIHTDVTDGSSYIYMGYENKKLEIQTTKREASIWITDGNQNTTIDPSEIRTPKLTQTSLESIKKNIEKFNKNAIEIIRNSDIYEYNLKSDKDTDKKMIGFVIGENYKTPNEVISKEGQAIEIYSMAGILWKAMQEQQKRIENLENKLKEVANG